MQGYQKLSDFTVVGLSELVGREGGIFAIVISDMALGDAEKDIRFGFILRVGLGLTGD